MTNYGSKYHEKFTGVTLHDDYKQFLNKYDKVVLIAFGTTYFTEKEELMKLMKVV